ncbi:rod shape-determining protein MreC [Betaproteobacteria bacterium]|nr:rod shape-determining protein MreC [Betaproteobacteria bacterium]GHT96654.1 rod shape-determining protein MreC [Betaproteobacteria bacterium]GHU00610.1 rod shape-determining protein MreC [Betaproteobacteria bacterium]GHU11914.1 rod shape-determining protein MreC [Betaproteobacteria bacterium]GHU19676.1 rod shape-determining protein MreC [Betaproteobacteria bacterium]
MTTADYKTLPVFRRSLTAKVRLLIFVAVSLAMLVADLRFRYLEELRQGLSVLTYPLQMLASQPTDFVRNASIYFATLAKVQLENAELRRNQTDVAERLLRFERLEEENTALRQLLAMAGKVKTQGVAAEVLYDAPDPFTRKVILDRGALHGVEPGLAVIDARGVVGQVTRIYPIQSEVTLLTDRDQAIPVQIERNQLRGVMFGTGHGKLELRFVLATADVRPGDRLVTSGLDGVFIPGLPVAVIETVERDTDAFARIACKPIAAVEQSTRVLVLGRQVLPPPRPQAEAAAKPGAEAQDRARRPARGRNRD